MNWRDRISVIPRFAMAKRASRERASWYQLFSIIWPPVKRWTKLFAVTTSSEDVQAAVQYAAELRETVIPFTPTA